MGCAPSKQAQVAPSISEPKLQNEEEAQQVEDGLAQPSDEINIEEKPPEEEPQLAEENKEGDAKDEETVDQPNQEDQKPEMEVVCGEGADLEEPKSDDWLEAKQDDQPPAIVVTDETEVPGGPVLESLTKQISHTSEQQPCDVKVGELDGLDIIKRFKLLFVKDDPQQLQARVDLLKEEITKLHEDNEYRILRLLSSMNHQAMEEAIESLKANKKKRCKSAFQGHLTTRQDTPIVEEEAIVPTENADDLLAAIQSAQQEEEGSQQTMETYLPPEEPPSAVENAEDAAKEPEILSVEGTPLPVEQPPVEDTVAPQVVPSEEVPKEDQPETKQESEDQKMEEPEKVEEDTVHLLPPPPQMKCEKQDSALESADGMISPHNSGVSTTTAPSGEDHRCITKADEGLVAQLLQEKQEQEQTIVEENPKITTGQTFVVEEPKPGAIITLPETPPPPPQVEVPPPRKEEPVKDDWNIENKQPQQEEPTISVNIMKKTYNSAVEQIKQEAQNDRPPSPGKHNKGGAAKGQDSRPTSRASSRASSQAKKAPVHEARPAAAKVTTRKKK